MMPTRKHHDDDAYATAESETDQEIAKLLQEREQKLIELEREKEALSKEKEKLERIKKRRIEFKQGQSELSDKFTRSLVLLERTENAARKNIEQMMHIRKGFEESLQEIKSIDPEEWNSKDSESELSKALSRIDHARLVYSQSKIKFDALTDTGEPEDNEDEDNMPDPADLTVPLSELLRRGFALSLPLIITLILVTWIIVTATQKP